MNERASEETATTLRVVGVKYKVAGTIYDFDVGAIDVTVGDSIVVEAERGMALATVATPPRPWSPEPGSAIPLRVLRKADDRDFAKEDENRRREREAHHTLGELIRARRLAMKLVKVEYGFDGSKATVYFFSENRVD